jgi:hypothetical protein
MVKDTDLLGSPEITAYLSPGGIPGALSRQALSSSGSTARGADLLSGDAA